MILPVRKKWIICIGMPVATLAFLAFYFMVDPAWKFMPRCPVYHLTGLKCPGCGTQRALHALLHGDFAAAWGFNPALILSIPLLLLIALSAAMRERAPRFYRTMHSVPLIIATGTAFLLWFLLRNILPL